MLKTTFTGFLHFYEQMIKHFEVNILPTISKGYFYLGKFIDRKVMYHTTSGHNIRIFLAESCSKPCHYEKKKKKLFQKYVSYLKEGNFLYHVNRSEMSWLLTDIFSTSGVKKPYFFFLKCIFYSQSPAHSSWGAVTAGGKIQPAEEYPWNTQLWWWRGVMLLSNPECLLENATTFKTRGCSSPT